MPTINNTNPTDWTLNTDVYDILNGVNEVKKQYMVEILINYQK